jgi:glycosyltransferase involved in cell wall biosynthesis
MVRVAYILSEFPSVSETFILREILELRRQGVGVQVFALRRGRMDVVHAEVAALLPEVDYRPAWTDRRGWQALAYWLARRPGTLRRMVGRIVRGTWRGERHGIHSLRSEIRNPKSEIRNPKSGRGLRSLLYCLRNVPAAAYFARRIEILELPHIHAHWAYMPTFVAWLAAELTDRPFSFTAHAWDIFQETTLLREKIAHAAWVATCSEYNRRHLETTYPDVALGKVFVAYHGLDFREWRKLGNRETGKLGCEAGETGKLGNWAQLPNFLISQFPNCLIACPLLLSVGRLQPKKGFPVLLEACALLRERGVEFRCVIVGEGLEWDRLQQMCQERCLTEAVMFAGALTQEELWPLYTAADAFALPCVVTPEGDRDGLPNAILEALAMGRPVVTTPVSAIPEVIVDGVTGLLVPPGDAAALADALERLLADADLRQRLGQQGQARVREQFDVTRNVAPLVERFTQANVIRDT